MPHEGHQRGLQYRESSVSAKPCEDSEPLTADQQSIHASDTHRTFLSTRICCHLRGMRAKVHVRRLNQVKV